MNKKEMIREIRRLNNIIESLKSELFGQWCGTDGKFAKLERKIKDIRDYLNVDYQERQLAPKKECEPPKDDPLTSMY